MDSYAHGDGRVLWIQAGASDNPARFHWSLFPSIGLCSFSIGLHWHMLPGPSLIGVPNFKKFQDLKIIKSMRNHEGV